MHRLAGRTMGTTWSVLVVLGEPSRLMDVRLAVETVLAQQVAIFSHWEPASELSRFNGSALGYVPVSDELWTVVETALDLAQQTDGAVDPTLGALVDLWGFGPPGPRAADRLLPDESEISAALKMSGWQRLKRDGDARSLFQPGGLRLDLSGIAKGHAVDRLSEMLAAMGIAHHLVEIGGELRGRGLKPDGLPWWAEIEQTDDCARPRTLVALHDLALATSGDTQRAFQVQGRRYSHTIDRHNGRPIVSGMISVSVMADTAMQADALATALNVLGPDDGPVFADLRDIAALFVMTTDRGPREILSAAAQAMMDDQR